MWNKLKEQFNLLKLEKKKLYLITNSDKFLSKDEFLDATASALQGGVDIVQLKEKEIPDNVYHSQLNIPFINGEYMYGKGDLFSVVLIFKYLLSTDDFRLFINEISYELDGLSGRLHSISINKVLDRMGFPTNYKVLLELE